MKTKSEKSKKKEKKVGPKYIENYINIALKYIEFFTESKGKEDAGKKIKINKNSFSGYHSFNSFDEERRKLFEEDNDNFNLLMSSENDIKTPLSFREPLKSHSIIKFEDEDVMIKEINDEEDEECSSKNEIINQFDYSLDENEIKKNCYENDIKNLISEHDKKFS